MSGGDRSAWAAAILCPMSVPRASMVTDAYQLRDIS